MGVDVVVSGATEDELGRISRLFDRSEQPAELIVVLALGPLRHHGGG